MHVKHVTGWRQGDSVHLHARRTSLVDVKVTVYTNMHVEHVTGWSQAASVLLYARQILLYNKKRMDLK